MRKSERDWTEYGRRKDENQIKKLRDKSLFVTGGGEWERYWGALGDHMVSGKQRRISSR